MRRSKSQKTSGQTSKPAAADQRTGSRKRKAEPCQGKTPAAKKANASDIQNLRYKKKLSERKDQSGSNQFPQNVIPCLSWTNSEDVWNNMLSKEMKYIHDKSFMKQHPRLEPHMRSNVLDYLTKVCEAYELQLETFYLEQDIFDRFIMTQVDIGTDQLQLIATTSLYIAAKVKGSYPPCIYAFACVTDGICTESEIRDCRILKALNWHLLPQTAVSWLKLYTQVDALKDCHDFLVCQFSQEKYIQMAQDCLQQEEQKNQD
ncbi:G1/S-specific cyclin-E2-like [Trichomycterus rosablanca]|uniref:G1/S-specific cyclin-E2-like n=1 Tax=Trichomycterus rosablanca TaxID=2290929 RepID=UPI002F359B2D